MPRFIRRPHNCVVGEGQVANFKCRVAASSPPVITWSFERQALNPSLKYMPKYSGLSYELRVARSKMEDKGEYTVKAENSYGSREATCWLDVEREYMYLIVYMFRYM